MASLRWLALPLVLLMTAACGGNVGPEPNRVLSAAGATAEDAGPPAPSTTTPTTVVPTTTTPPAPATTTTAAVRRTQTTRAPVTSTPPIAGYSPASPPPGVEADGYGGYGGVTTTSGAGVSVQLRVYPREQYLGEIFQTSVNVERPEGISVTSLKIDYGNGQVVTFSPTNSWYCGTAGEAGNSKWYTYPAPGTFRISATATVVPCMGGIPGGVWIGPHYPPPEGLVGPWFPEPHRAVSASMEIVQRPDRVPPPVGRPPGP